MPEHFDKLSATPKRPLKVFLCHARDDKSKARELYRYLPKFRPNKRQHGQGRE